MLRRWVALVVGLCAVVLITPRVAQADTSTAHSVAVAVLALDSDDAEEQADALTGALRSRIRASQGWSLIDTTQSLGMLTAALRCPGKPIPADCEQRISEHLKSDRFIFGYVTKGPVAGQVTAEVHLYQKSKPDTVIRASFSDNLKDANDDTLRASAQKIIERLGGSAVGTIIVKMGTENGEVIVDGEKHVPLANGVAHVELSPGPHSVEVSTKNGTATQKRNVAVTAGKETVVDLALSNVVVGPTEPPKEEKPFPVRKAIGGGLAVLGLASGVVSLVMFLKWNSDKDAGVTAEIHNPLPNQKKAADVCGKDPNFPSTTKLCVLQDDAVAHSTVSIITGAAGAVLIGAGAVLFFTGGSSSSNSDKQAPPPEAKTKIKNLRAAPIFGGSTTGFALSGSF